MECWSNEAGYLTLKSLNLLVELKGHVTVLFLGTVYFALSTLRTIVIRISYTFPSSSLTTILTIQLFYTAELTARHQQDLSGWSESFIRARLQAYTIWTRPSHIQRSR